MFKNYRLLSTKEKVHILISVIVILIPIATYAYNGALHMHENKVAAMAKQSESIEISQEKLDQLYGAVDSERVQVGIYIESITDVSVKDNSWKAKFLLWFRWEGEAWEPSKYPGSMFIIGNGDINSKTLIEEYHQDGVHYQQYRVTATLEKYFDTTRYPLDSHQLKIFIEDDRDISEVTYVAAIDSTISPDLIVAGFDVLSYDHGIYLNEYPNDLGHPVLEEKGFDGKKTMEYLFTLRVNRSGYGQFLKAFLSLLGILLWVCIGLYNCAYNMVDAMGTVNTGIFGVVSSMIVGMNLLSDARGSGLIEYINFFALAMILMITIFVIRINRLRVRGVKEAYTTCYAKALFWLVSTMSITTVTAFICSAVL